MARILLFLLVSSATLAQSDCTLRLEKDSIRVFTCDQEHSKFKSIKTVFQVVGDRSQVAAMILDIDFYKEWQYKTLSTKVLKRVSDRELIYYTEVAAPVLTSNRDFVIRLTVENVPDGSLSISAVSLPDYIPPKQGALRVPYSVARWKVQSVGPSTLRVEYTLDIDLGGDVPAWLVNAVAPQAPYETFKAFREKIVKYTGQRVPFITD
ncbi:MAG: START domain-containing protein [Cytophagales bacterium]|nr:START domain-containing protein [Cytophagales bacterium]